jgi:FKBP12-rapamycin complex-associated protein
LLPFLTLSEALKDSDERHHILAMWEKRLRGCQPSTKTWEKILAVRSLAIKPDTNLGSWLSYGAIAQKSGQLRYARL